MNNTYGIEPFFPVRIYVTIFAEESNLNNPIKACCHYTSTLFENTEV